MVCPVRNFGYIELMSLQINPAAEVTMRRIGREGHPLLIIDDVMANADALVETAAATPFSPPVSAYYPGVNAPMPDDYLRTLMPVLRPSFERAFGIAQTAPMVAAGFFALSTQPVEALQPLQKIPHYDQIEPGHLAMVHYLARDMGGGTGFFRHKTSGFESIDSVRRDAYMGMVAGELGTVEPTRFAGPDTPNYELLDQADLRFNRLIIYRSNVLHCALFDGARLTDDPRTGRLTANSFFKPR